MGEPGNSSFPGQKINSFHDGPSGLRMDSADQLEQFLRLVRITDNLDDLTRLSVVQVSLRDTAVYQNRVLPGQTRAKVEQFAVDVNRKLDLRFNLHGMVYLSRQNYPGGVESSCGFPPG